MEKKEKIVVRRMPDPGDLGWMVSLVSAVGKEKGIAMLCGGNIGRVLALMCARQIGELKSINTFDIDPELTSTED